MEDSDYVSEFKISFLRPRLLSTRSYLESISKTDGEFEIHDMIEAFVAFLRAVGYSEDTIKRVFQDYYYDPEEIVSDEEE